MVKVTFTLDDETVATLRRSAERLGKPQSAVVREAIADHAARIGKLSETERRAMLKTFDELVARIPLRPARTADDELRAIRRARHTGGRRHGR
ncbi:MAG TPA: ribbon-helix-helix protein, CopG family [Vicinamibacterales bacterium]|nr:ribbon-helix-helix protein, CopG family [Vicinamibacterales bacterium]